MRSGSSWIVVARTLPGAALAWILLGAAPVVVTAVRHGDDYSIALRIGAVLIGAGAAFAVEDAAASVIASSAITLLARRAVRAAIMIVLIASVAALAVAIADRGQAGTLMLPAHGVVLLASGCVAVALAALLDRRDGASSGLVGATGGVGVVMTLAVLSTRVAWLPDPLGPRLDRGWLVVAVIGAVAALWASRDPAQPRWHLAGVAGSSPAPTREGIR